MLPFQDLLLPPQPSYIYVADPILEETNLPPSSIDDTITDDIKESDYFVENEEPLQLEEGIQDQLPLQPRTKFYDFLTAEGSH